MTKSSASIVIAFGSGIVFAIGLGISEMTSPAKILAFLDVTSSSWDPSLVFVMIGAIGVHFLFATRAKRFVQTNRSPFVASRFYLPDATHVDRSLLLGAILFGVGWGLAGYCPGPAIVSMISGVRSPTQTHAIVWVIAMLAGIWLVRIRPDYALQKK